MDEDLKKLTCNKLKGWLRVLGHPTKGTKQELILRLSAIPVEERGKLPPTPTTTAALNDSQSDINSVNEGNEEDERQQLDGEGDVSYVNVQEVNLTHSSENVNVTLENVMKELQLLKRERELDKRENDLLRRECELLRSGVNSTPLKLYYKTLLLSLRKLIIYHFPKKERPIWALL